jgi:hypothetical protein
MKHNPGLAMALLMLLFGFTISAQPVKQDDSRLVDNNLKFMVISERVHSRGMMEICISDTSDKCIYNLLSGFVVRIYDAEGHEIWAGKTAGRDEILRFPKPMPEASWITFTAFKPYVINRITGARIYQDRPIQIKYLLSDE